MRLLHLDLNSLVTLELLLAERSLTRAADRLNLSQPAVSNTLTRLREHFNDELLVRHGREMECTPFAEGLRTSLNSALVQLRSIALARPGFDPSSTTRTFNVVSSDYVATVFLAEAMQHISELAPGVSVRHVPLSYETIGQFESGNSDAIVLPGGKLLNPSLPQAPLFTDDFVCIARESSTSFGDDIAVEEYFQNDRISPSYKEFWVDQNWQQHASQAKGTSIALPFTATPWLVARSHFIAAIPRRLAKLYSSTLPIKIVPFRNFGSQPQFVLQWQADLHRDPAAGWVIEQLQLVGQRMSENINENPELDDPESLPAKPAKQSTTV